MTMASKDLKWKNVILPNNFIDHMSQLRICAKTNLPGFALEFYSLILNDKITWLIKSHSAKIESVGV